MSFCTFGWSQKNATAPTRSWMLVMLVLLSLVGQAQAADKIIYIRPVPMNDDPLLKQGSKGINQAAQMYGLDAHTLESQPNRESRLQQLDAAVKQGAKLVVLMGHEFKEPLASFASKAPKTRFLILDHCIDNPQPNVSCILFRETEASYLAGMEAALVSNSGKLGIIGALDTPARRKNVEAFSEGAKAANPNIVIREPQWINGEQPFNDPARAEQLAKALLGDGTDIIYAMASASNRGAFHAVSGNSNARIIGNSINQCPLAPGKVLDNIEVSMDTAIVLAVGEALKGALPAHIDYGMKEGAVSLTGLERDIAFSDCEIMKHRPVIQKLRDAKKSLLSRK